MHLSKSVTAIVLSFAFARIANTQTIQINRENKTIAISTTDEATATADIAAISIGFGIFRPDADAATIEGTRLSHTIMDALHKAGVEDRNIESIAQGLSRNTEFDDKETAQQRVQRQFRFVQSWEVTADPKDAAAILRVAFAS